MCQNNMKQIGSKSFRIVFYLLNRKGISLVLEKIEMVEITYKLFKEKVQIKKPNEQVEIHQFTQL